MHSYFAPGLVGGVGRGLGGPPLSLGICLLIFYLLRYLIFDSVDFVILFEGHLLPIHQVYSCLYLT
ncbi:Uncharacterised protein [Vibrio cholerae]|uniref:Uncharacterized protein n=1 Tax=Vibrio cholerae TaxID=666 RepID=A0A656AZP9_VIBCL|nr:Uncharacterised protein [Vibrio cholerae]CSA96843.1 Uncharacterised protein [Vibrio cholerae]CSB05932.1 Uncharacterised protein [Vibrio cholerae]CSB08411.1 Uncharacterised protein [Vibrio cholerae]CSB16789.1 Uncharacterised protein [Vibrio cholerae]